MKISDKGIDEIKKYEGFVPHPYLDVAMVPTIGYGTTHYMGRPVSLDDHDISEKTATQFLRDQVDAIYGKAVNHYVRVPMTQNQFDALVSFTYNEGTHALKTSHLLKKINAGKLTDAKAEFSKWKYANGRANRGLLARRESEASLYLA